MNKSTRPTIPRKTIYRLSIYLRCLARLREKVAVRNADEARPARRAGRVPRAEKERRLTDKAHRARRKRDRAAPPVDDG